MLEYRLLPSSTNAHKYNMLIFNNEVGKKKVITILYDTGANIPGKSTVCCDRAKIKINNSGGQRIGNTEIIKNGKIKLVTSYMTEYENAQNPIESRRKNIAQFQKENESVHVKSTAVEKNLSMIADIEGTGIKHKDAIHIVCAKLAEADYLVSTDDRLLKYQTNDIHLVTPIEFLNKWEEIENDNEHEGSNE